MSLITAWLINVGDVLLVGGVAETVVKAHRSMTADKTYVRAVYLESGKELTLAYSDTVERVP